MQPRDAESSETERRIHEEDVRSALTHDLWFSPPPLCLRKLCASGLHFRRVGTEPLFPAEDGARVIGRVFNGKSRYSEVPRHRIKASGYY